MTLYKEIRYPPKNLMVNVKITNDDVKMQKVSEAGDRTDIVVAWKDISNYIKEIFNDR